MSHDSRAQPNPVADASLGLLSRLAMQIAASTLLTIFYTPGGVAGWTLELICRWYPGIARRLAPLRLVPIPVWDRRARRSVE